MKVAIVYDCLFPNTVGGAERWYRSLAERLDQRHSVTYVTRRQWDDRGPETPFETIAVAPARRLYTRGGRRRIWPPIRFGIGVFWHLWRRGSDYDAVHCASFPYFSLLAAGIALRLRRRRARLIADWHEVWGRQYWRSYLGPVRGRIGFAIERSCVRLPDRSFTFSTLAEGRLRELGHDGPITRLTGEYAEGADAADPRLEPPEPPRAVAAGRQIPEKRVAAVPPAIAAARDRVPGLGGLLLGDGPEAVAIQALVRELGLEDVVQLPGRVRHDELLRAIAAASCLVHPSEREGYGMVVVEAASVGTPAILVAGPENAATELIDDGVNGFVIGSADPKAIADAIVRVIEGGAELRARTLDWYERHRDELSIETSLELVEAAYSAPVEGP